MSLILRTHLKMKGEILKTEWNSSEATLRRVDEALKDCRAYRYSDNWVGWLKGLGSLMSEAIVKMAPEEQGTAKERYVKLEEKVAVLARAKTKVSSFNTKIDNELLDYELWLRFIIDKKGMLLADRERDSGL